MKLNEIVSTGDIAEPRPIGYRSKVLRRHINAAKKRKRKKEIKEKIYNKLINFEIQ